MRSATAAFLASVFISITIASAQTGTPPPDSAAGASEAGRFSISAEALLVRSGNQINRTVNPTQSTPYTEDPAARLQSPGSPSFKFNSSDFWAQGIHVGLAFRF